MTHGRSARSKFYDGRAYGRLIEPLLEGVHGFVAERLPDGNRVLDACCGTGGLSRMLAAQGRTVVGIDLSPANIEFARRTSGAEGISDGQLSFEVGDVATLEVPDEGPFDAATVVLALHEMPREHRVPVVQALCRVAHLVMIVDYAIPMPWNVAGVRNRGLEVAAGFEHFSAFVSYSRRGGLPKLLAQAGAEVQADRRIDGDTLQVVLVRGENVYRTGPASRGPEGR